MAAYGILVARIPWSLIGFIWVYNLVWLFLVDMVKLAEKSQDRPHAHRPAALAKVAEAVTCADCLVPTLSIRSEQQARESYGLSQGVLG